MNYLIGRMNTGIGTPGTGYPDRFIRNAGKRRLQVTLDRRGVFILVLPSMVRRAVVGYSEGYTVQLVHAMTSLSTFPGLPGIEFITFCALTCPS